MTTFEPQPIQTQDDHRALVVNKVNEGEDVIVISWRSDEDPGFRDAEGMTPRQARDFAIALLRAANVAEGRG